MYDFDCQRFSEDLMSKKLTLFSFYKIIYNKGVLPGKHQGLRNSYDCH